MNSKNKIRKVVHIRKNHGAGEQRTYLEEIARVIRGSRSSHYVIKDEIDHKIHATTMELGRELLEIISCAETGVELRDVGDPVASVCVAILCARAIVIFVDGRNPYYGKVNADRRGGKAEVSPAVKPASWI